MSNVEKKVFSSKNLKKKICFMYAGLVILSIMIVLSLVIWWYCSTADVFDLIVCLALSFLGIYGLFALSDYTKNNIINDEMNKLIRAAVDYAQRGEENGNS